MDISKEVHNIFEVVLVELDDARVFINESCKHLQPWQIIAYTAVSVATLIWFYGWLFDPEVALTVRIKKSFFKTIRSLPIIGTKIQEEVDKTKSQVASQMFPLPKGHSYIRHMPQQGKSEEELLNMMKMDYKGAMETIDWMGGKVSGSVYAGGPEHDKFMSKVFEMFCSDNLLQPDVFPGARKMEAEIVAMMCNLYKGGPRASGTVTGGGTESILMACKAYRHRAYEKGIKYPEILMPESAHAAFVKAGVYFRMPVVKIPIDRKTCAIDVKEMKKRITKNTCMLVGSAPTFPHGITDPLPEIAALGKKYDIPVHMDACMGGFFIPFMKECGFEFPECNFEALTGLTSISADTHKYGLTPKGTSVVIYRDKTYREGQYFVQTDWCGGIYASPTVQGARSGALVATCWASIMHVGQDGYRNNTHAIVETRQRLEKGLREISEIYVFGKPLLNIITIGSHIFDVYRLMDILTKKGWHLYTVQYPPGLNLCVTPFNATSELADSYINDVRTGVAKIMQNPKAKADGMGAIYGSAEKIPDKSIVDDFVMGYLDSYYDTTQHSTKA